MKSMKKIAALSMAALMAFGAVGCSTGKTSQDNTAKKTSSISSVKIDKPVTVEFWHAMSGPVLKVLQQFADDFHAKNPNITIKLVAQGNYTGLSQKLMAAAKANTSPAMAQAYSTWQTEYISNDLLEDLTPYFNDKTVGMTDKDKKDIIKSFIDDNTWKGKVYGVPFNKSTEVLYYNKTYFDKMNVQIPKTWSDLQKAAKTLTTTIDGKSVTGLGFESSVTGDLATYIKQAGGDYVTADGKVKFNSAQGKKALQFLYDMVVKDKTARLAGEDGYMSEPFGRGDVAMYIGSSAGTSYVAKGIGTKYQWSTAALPKDVKAASPFQGTNAIIFKSASAEQKLAAWEFAKFLSDKEQTTTWAEKTGYVPVRQSVLSSDEWKSFISKHPEQAAAEDQFSSAFSDVHVGGADKLRTDVSKVFDEVLHGQKAVSAGLTEAEQAAKRDISSAK